MKKLLLALCLYFIALEVSMAQVYSGNLSIGTQAQIDAFNYSEITGNLTIQGTDMTNLKKLLSLTKIGGSFFLNSNSISNCDGLQNLSEIGVWLQFISCNNLSTLSGLSGLKRIGGLSITNCHILTDLSGLSALTTIGGGAIISNDGSLTTIGMSALTSVTGSLEMKNNTNLKNLNGLSALRTVGGNFLTVSNPTLTDICAIRPLAAEGSVGSYHIYTATGNYHSKEAVLAACPVAPNNALAFDGVDDFVQVGAPDFYGGSFTIEGWIKTKKKGEAIFLIYQESNNASAVYAEVNINGTISFVVRNPPANAGGAVVMGKKSVVDDKWYHFAVVKRDDNYLYLYIDGEPDGKSSGKVGNFSTTTYKMRLGMNVPTSPRYYQGSMDEIRCWSIARAPGDITRDMNKSLSGTEAGLAVYYKFNQGTANGTNTTETTLKDEKGALNGTLIKFGLSGSTSNFTTGWTQ